MSDALFARTWNAGAPGETVVLLHGFGGCADVWEDVAERLGRPVLAYDLPGHRFSNLTEGKGVAREAARLVLGDLAARGIARPVLAGHSLGGAAALLAAMSAPDRFSRLVLLAPGGIGEEIAEPLLRGLGEAREEAAIAAALAAMVAPGAPPPPARTVEALRAMRQRPGENERLGRIASGLAAGGRQGVIPADRLALLGLPVTVLWGQLDPVLPFAQTARLPENWSLWALEGAGHMLIEEAPAAVVAALDEDAPKSGSVVVGLA